ncbi:MAG: MmgE/PrpD family protein, partial [Alphaproteobacteria bacterium]|nr:MmgE/PrpD family protein [Alphaproteobacteria bacterium]
MTISEQLTGTVSWLFEAEPLASIEVEHRARLLFLDTLGCMIAGLAKPEPGALAGSLAALEPGTVKLPHAPPLTPGSAAYMAGLAACWDEACEGLPRAHGRPGLHAFATALPLGLARDHTFGETLGALVAGFEIAGRLGECLRIRPGMHVDGTWGTFGAVAAAARLLGLDTEDTVAALQGAACQIPFSLYLPISHGATVRNTYVGEAARRGISVALAVQAGVGSPPGAMEVFDQLALGGAPDSKALVPVGEWLLLEGYLKPFAAVRHVHYGAQAALEWRRKYTDTSGITALELAIYGEALTYCGNRAPATPIQAQFSLSYGLAWALMQGDLGPEAYHESSLQNAEVRRLEALVHLVEEPRFTARNQRAARLTIGSDTIVVDAVPGEPHLPLSAGEVAAKFSRYVGPILGADRAMAG